MSSLGQRLVAAARSRLGQPFRHHYKPDNCLNGTVTVDSCMERGLGPQYYDCSGLVIASLCQIIGISVDKWPRNYRHQGQMEDELTSFTHEPVPGHVVLLRGVGRNGLATTHMGILAARCKIIHASGSQGAVVEDAAPTLTVERFFAP